MTTLQEEDDFGAAEVRRRQDVARKLRLQVVLVLIIMMRIINIEWVDVKAARAPRQTN